MPSFFFLSRELGRQREACFLVVSLRLFSREFEGAGGGGRGGFKGGVT